MKILPALAPGPEWHLTDRCEVVDHLAQHLQLFSDGGQLFGICSQVVTVATSSFAAEIKKKFGLLPG